MHHRLRRPWNEHFLGCGHARSAAGSTVPNQPARVFWAVVNRLFIIFQVVVLVLSEIGWPAAFFDRFFPVLGPTFSLGALGIFQCLVLSHHVDNFTLVAAFSLFARGCLNMLLGLVFREKAKAMRSIMSWRAGVLPSHRDMRPTFAPLASASFVNTPSRMQTPAPVVDQLALEFAFTQGLVLPASIECERKRERILFALKHGKISKEVKTLTTKLEDSFHAFMIQTALNSEQSMNTLTSGNIRMLQHIDDAARVGEVVLGETGVIRRGLSDLALRIGGSATFDGNFRLFARENLALLDPIVDSCKQYHTTKKHRDEYTLVHSATQARTGRVSRCRAVVEAAGGLTGTQVVVHTYPTNRNDQRFVETVKFAKRTCHPYVLAMLGYSHPGDPGEAAYIVTEDYVPFPEYLGSLGGISKLRAYLEMRAATCTAVDHLEAMELYQRLPKIEYWDHSTYHPFGLDELVFDHRRGGRIKWAGNLVVLEETARDPLNLTNIPTAQTARTRMIEDVRAIAYGNLNIVVQCWLWQTMSTIGLSMLIHGIHSGYGWDVPTVPNPGLFYLHEIPGSRSPQSCRGYQAYVPLRGKNTAIPNSSEQAWFHGTGKDGTRWKRYQFSCIPVNTTLLFQQLGHVPDAPDATAWMVRLLLDPSVIGRHTCIGIATHRVYYTETTITMTPRAAEKAPPPLWFFVLQFDGGDNYSHDRTVPCGFWSLDKHPTSIPADILLDALLQRSEPGEKGTQSPPFTSTQVLGDLIFTTRTKMRTSILQLNEDELLAFREVQESLYRTSDVDASHLDASGTGVPTTHDNGHEDITGESSDTRSLESSSSDVTQTARIVSIATDADYQGTMDPECGGTGRYRRTE
ncbi:hypothetical protein VTO73DRAFT_10187 [Trametes versicolor]